MSFAVIDIDGGFAVHNERPTAELIREHVAGWWDYVPLPATPTIRGWVNDTGLVDGTTPRNAVGAVLLMCCGAPGQPYAGPVVITGWCDVHEIEPLSGGALDALQLLHRDVTAAIAGDDQAVVAGTPERWASTVREAAKFARTAPTRGPVILTGEDAIRALRGQR